MKSIKLTFTRAATGKTGLSLFWMMVWAVAILDDAERREIDKRKKRDRHAKPGC